MTPPTWRRFLRLLGPDVDADVDDELRFHLDMRRREFEARGLPPDDADKAARTRFGDLESIGDALRQHDRRRERRRQRSESMRDFITDLRYALRGFLHARSFTFVVVLTLTLGIGATTAIFSVVNSVLLRPLAFREPDRLVNVWMDNRRMGLREDIHSRANFEDLRSRNRTLTDLAGFTRTGMNLTGGCREGECEPRRIMMAASTAALWPVLGVSPALGRVFTAAEEVQGSDAVVVLSHGLWSEQFGGDSAVLGRLIRLNGRERAVIGVMPPSFRFPDGDTRGWIPLAQPTDAIQNRGGFFLWAVGRLRPGVSVEAARADLDLLARQLEEEYPVNRDLGAWVVPLEEQVVGRQMRTALWTMLAAVGAVLLIACANVANLMLSRAAAREREMGVRAALGAGRGRLLRQLLAESISLAAVGAIAGLGLAWGGLRLLMAMAPADLPRRDEVAIDATVLLVTLGVTLACGVGFALLSARQAAGGRVAASLREGTRGTSSRSSQRFRRLLAGVQVALVVVLLTASGLLIRSFLALQATDLGFRPDGLLMAELTLPGAKYQEPASRIAFFDQVFERLRANPDVVGLGAIRDVFISSLPNSGTFTIEGRERTADVANTEVPLDPVTPDYFQVMGIPLLEGRAFAAADAPDAPPVVIINRNMADKFWPTGDALGKRIKYGDGDSQAPWMTIVGIVADMRRTGYDAAVRYETFYPYAQGPATRMQVVVRTRSDPVLLVPALRAAVREVDAEQPITTVTSMTTRLGEMMAQRQFAMVLMGTFAAVALVLGLIGVYGVTSYLVAQRSQEMGVRLALGATSNDVVAMVVRQGMLVAVVGVVAGLVGAFATTRLLGSLLYEVKPFDIVTFGLVVVTLIGTTLLANWIPARRAARVDPLEALRTQ